MNWFDAQKNIYFKKKNNKNKTLSQKLFIT